ncbi:MAG: DUF503 domain-containing protein [Dehalococcoidia bacterium]|nr:DUF503 domain-containing protein [Dehalococcoidia bacterium]
MAGDPWGCGESEQPVNVVMCRVTLQLAENYSLKGKRQLLQSVTQRVRQRFNVSIAEVGEQGRWQTAVLLFHTAEEMLFGGLRWPICAAKRKARTSAPCSSGLRRGTTC